MTDSANESAIKSAVALLTYYSFDPGDATGEQLLDRWLRAYPSRWVRLALIEALYQGRYKAISVEQLLALWQRRGQPLFHFNHEFERLVCNNFPRDLRLHQTPRRTQARFWRSRPISPTQAEPLAFSPEVAELAPSGGTPNPDRPPEQLLTELKPPEATVTAPQPLPLEPPPTTSTPVATAAIAPAETTPATPAPQPQEWPAALPAKSNSSSGKDPIHHFTPATIASEFYTKLSAIALAERKHAHSLPISSET